jgi:hypothetical protein
MVIFPAPRGRHSSVGSARRADRTPQRGVPTLNAFFAKTSFASFSESALNGTIFAPQYGHPHCGFQGNSTGRPEKLDRYFAG